MVRLRTIGTRIQLQLLPLSITPSLRSVLRLLAGYFSVTP